MEEYQRGRVPDPAAWAARHPEHADELHAYVALIQQTPRLADVVFPPEDFEERALAKAKPYMERAIAEARKRRLEGGT